ncbi:hypothetical protein C8F04DRAFT_950734, partial [Mycena alexandri]
MAFLDHCLPFGLATAGGIWGIVTDSIIEILHRNGVSATYKWVDDFLFFHIPN